MPSVPGGVPPGPQRASQAANKYYGEQDERHPGHLHWPGVDGFPFLGEKAPLLRAGEMYRLPVVGYSYHRTFNLADEKDSADYRWIRDRITNNIFRRDHVEYHWDSETKTMIVYLEWTQIYATSVPKNGSQSDAFLLE